jgi:hypothetical protein
VNEESSWQTIPARDFSFAWATTTEHPTFREQFGACRVMNRAIHAASAEKRRVSGINNGIGFELCDVALKDFNSAVEILHESFGYNDGSSNDE